MAVDDQIDLQNRCSIGCLLCTARLHSASWTSKVAKIMASSQSKGYAVHYLGYFWGPGALHEWSCLEALIRGDCKVHPAHGPSGGHDWRWRQRCAGPQPGNSLLVRAALIACVYIYTHMYVSVYTYIDIYILCIQVYFNMNRYQYIYTYVCIQRHSITWYDAIQNNLKAWHGMVWTII